MPRPHVFVLPFKMVPQLGISTKLTHIKHLRRIIDNIFHESFYIHKLRLNRIPDIYKFTRRYTYKLKSHIELFKTQLILDGLRISSPVLASTKRSNAILNF